SADCERSELAKLGGAPRPRRIATPSPTLPTRGRVPIGDVALLSLRIGWHLPHPDRACARPGAGSCGEGGERGTRQAPDQQASPMIPGSRNLITDVDGLLVGNAEDHALRSGTTVLLADRPLVASVDVMGGSPGSRETELLAPDKLVEAVDAIVLSGGSAFGLDAASGVAEAMRRQGRGYRVETAIIPIVPAAIIFDLLNGGDKDWDVNPYGDLGARALAAASADFALGTA